MTTPLAQLGAMITAAIVSVVPIALRVDAAIGTPETGNDTLAALIAEVDAEIVKARCRTTAAKKRVSRFMAREAELVDMTATLRAQMTRNNNQTLVSRLGARPGR